MAHLQRSVLVIVLFAFSACSQISVIESETSVPTPAETATPYTAGTQTAEAALSLPTFSFSNTALPTFALPPAVLPTVVLPTLTPTVPRSTSTPLPTVTNAPMPPGFSPIVYGRYILLGGVEGGTWLAPDQAFARFAGATEYDVYSFSGKVFHLHGHAPMLSMLYRTYHLRMDGNVDEFGMLGVAQGWQVTQRAVEELPSENESYRQVMLDWLSQEGVVDPQIGTMQIYRTDLEGDGSDEIFISDTRVESQHTARPGDHSIILMRKVVGSEAVTIPIRVDLYAYVRKDYINPFPCMYSIGNFIDLNQDGTLEVVVEYQRWEGFGASIYQVDGRNVEEVLGTACSTQRYLAINKLEGF